MASAFLHIHSGPATAPPEGALAVFRKQGLGPAETFKTPNATLALYPYAVGDPAASARDGDDWCAIAGTLLFDGSAGAEAASNVLAAWRVGSLDETRLFGAYAVFLYCGRELAFFTDRLGSAKLYRSGDGAVLSTSFLATAECLTKRTLNTQAAYEYVFQGACYGSETPLREVVTVEPGFRYRLSDAPGSRLRSEPRPWPLPAAPRDAPFEEHVAANLEQLGKVYDAIVGAFGNAVDAALSGGYDSRLTLALLRARGLRPHVHVYGKPTDGDVRIAKQIAAGEGFEIDHVDKSLWLPPAGEEAAETVARNFLMFDGWPTDGIFDNGVDLTTRLARAADGRLALNGGGGEVFRNFFYLPGRPLPARSLLWTFYSRYDPKALTGVFDEARYLDRLEAKLISALGASGPALTRAQVELAYPLFRCRFWTGHNTATNNRIGPALTPFVEPPVVAAAAEIPLAMKNHGRIEAAMIRQVDPKLAAYPSDYGFDFAQDPPLGARLKDRLTYARPPALRRFSYRIQHRMMARSDGRSLLSDLRDLMPDGPDLVSRLFRLDRCRDREQVGRIATLDYLTRSLKIDLPEFEG
ncbi:MAG: hypothetical protein MI755_04950 [Sphingomonadales bacterium]|nr:hypothetical protein [Sphingomonadales bacterium]